MPNTRAPDCLVGVGRVLVQIRQQRGDGHVSELLHYGFLRLASGSFLFDRLRDDLEVAVVGVDGQCAKIG